jgi:porin
MTQFVGGNAHGGTKKRANYFGSLDLWGNLDTTKLSNGVWPGAEISFHGEVAWGRDIQNPRGLDSSVGAAVPVVYDITMPLATDTGQFTLSEYSVVQALSPKLSLWVGQSNGAALIDGNAFASSEKHLFLNTSMIDNPAVGAFAPYTCTSIAAVYFATPEHLFLGSVMDSQGRANKPVWNTYHTDATLGMLSYGWLPEFDGKPGRYQVVVAYTNTDTVSYAISNRLALLGEVLGLVPIKEKTDNYISLGTFDQYLYVKDKEKQIGWGLFARYGYSPKNRNAIDQFYSVGVGGRGCIIPGRDLDFWGLGWGGSHFSSDLRDDLQLATSLPARPQEDEDLEGAESRVGEVVI